MRISDWSSDVCSSDLYDSVLKREVSTTERIRMVTIHESVGHHGIEAITGPELWAELEQTIDRMRGQQRYAELFNQIDRRYRGANRSIATREAIAVMAEQGVRNSVIDRVIADRKSTRLNSRH